MASRPGKARRINNIGAGFGEGLQAADGVVEIWAAMKKILGSGGENEVGIVSCFSGCGYALDSRD